MRHYCPLCKEFKRPETSYEGRRGHRQPCVYEIGETKIYKRCPECQGVLLEWWEPEMLETQVRKETSCYMKELLAGAIQRFLR